MGLFIWRRTKATFKRKDKIRLKNIDFAFLNEEIRRFFGGFFNVYYQRIL